MQKSIFVKLTNKYYYKSNEKFVHNTKFFVTNRRLKKLHSHRVTAGSGFGQMFDLRTVLGSSRTTITVRRIGQL